MEPGGSPRENHEKVLDPHDHVPSLGRGLSMKRSRVPKAGEDENAKAGPAKRGKRSGEGLRSVGPEGACSSNEPERDKHAPNPDGRSGHVKEEMQGVKSRRQRKVSSKTLRVEC